MPEGAYNHQFEPVARVGDVIDVQSRGIYRVTALGPQPNLQPEDEFTVADTESEKRELTDTEQRKNFLAQYRLPQLASRLPDDVVIRIDHDGRQEPLYEAKNVRGELDNEVGAIYSQDGSGSVVQEEQLTAFTELFIYEDNVPYFEVENNSGSQITYTPRFVGYQFALEELNSVPGGTTPVAVPSRSIKNIASE